MTPEAPAMHWHWTNDPSYKPEKISFYDKDGKERGYIENKLPLMGYKFVEVTKPSLFTYTTNEVYFTYLNSHSEMRIGSRETQVTICLTNGFVKFNGPVNEAASNFWHAVTEAFPEIKRKLREESK